MPRAVSRRSSASDCARSSGNRLDPGRVDPLGEVVLPLVARAAVDGDLTAGQQAGAASSGRCGRRSTPTTATAPGRCACTSRDGSGPSASRMSSTSLRNSSLASSQSRVSSQGGHGRHLGEMQPQVGHRADAVAVVVHLALLEQLDEVDRLVRRAQPRPADQVVARRDRRGRVHRQRGEVVDHAEQVGRPPRVEQGRADDDLSGLLPGQVVGLRHGRDASRDRRRPTRLVNRLSRAARDPVGSQAWRSPQGPPSSPPSRTARVSRPSCSCMPG